MIRVATDAIAGRRRMFDSNFKQRISKDEFQGARRIRLRVAAARNARVMDRTWPSEDRGRREDRVPTAPMVRVQQKARGRTTGTGGSSGLPCAMVYGLYVISPVTMLGCHRRLARHLPRDLAPASERQDHTISPSAAMPLVVSASPASIASRPTFVTTRTPLVEVGCDQTITISEKTKWKISRVGTGRYLSN
jgi:hypothetical protein